MAANKSLVRGDLVQYAGKTYYFQPNGTTCYLYEKEEDVGHTSLAAKIAPRSKVMSSPVLDEGEVTLVEEKEEEEPALVLSAEIAKLGPKQLQLVEDLVVMLRNMNLAAGANRVYQ